MTQGRARGVFPRSPITACAAGRALDPTPCLAAADLEVGPLAGVGPGGVLQVAEQLAAPAVRDLAVRGEALDLPIQVGGAAVAHLAWPLAFERPADLVLPGTEPGSPGPRLEVRAGRLGPARLAFEVRGSGPELLAVVEWAESAGFRIASRGATGAAGSPGMDGSWGWSGSAASCPSTPGGAGLAGGPGSAGGSGGPGGPGGRGGHVHAVVASPPELIEETLARVRATLASEGGPAGPGGPGGPGGRGGQGGSGGGTTSCSGADGQTFWLPGGPEGPRGSDGPDGPAGSAGPQGLPGEVHVEPSR